MNDKNKNGSSVWDFVRDIYGKHGLFVAVALPVVFMGLVWIVSHIQTQNGRKVMLFIIPLYTKGGEEIPTPTPTPSSSPLLTPTPTPTPSSSPLLTPTPTPRPSSSPLLTPTPTPRPSSSPLLTPTPSLPPTATSAPSLLPKATVEEPIEIKKKDLSETIEWSDTTFKKQINRDINGSYTFRCPSLGQRIDRVWGSNPYHGGSSICEAAVHAGVITYSEGGIVIIQIRGKQPPLKGSQKNGVTSKSFPYSRASFVVTND